MCVHASCPCEKDIGRFYAHVYNRKEHGIPEAILLKNKWRSEIESQGETAQTYYV